MDIGAIWDLIILQPVINSLIWLSDALFSNFGLTIIIFTVFTRVLMYPLTKKQLRATKGMQELQPKLQELQKKYGKDKQAMAKEQMRLYKESGLNPAGCMLPMLVQLPVWIALYQSIIRILAISPEDFLSLSRYLYSWPVVYSALPLAKNFLGLDLAEPNFIVAVLVGGTMWIQQKMAMPVTSDPRQQAQSQMMLWMMPLLFGYFCVMFPSGLSLYWLVSNVITIVMQYFVTGWGALAPGRTREPGTRDRGLRKRISSVEIRKDETPSEADIVVSDTTSEEQTGSSSEAKPKDTYPAGFRPVQRQYKKSKGHRHKR